MADNKPNEAAEALVKEVESLNSALNLMTKKDEENQQAIIVLEKENANLKGQISNLEQEKEMLASVNEELQAKVEELSKATGADEKQPEPEKLEVPTGTFKVGSNSYCFVTPVFMLNGQRIVATAAMQDQALLEKIVKMKCGFITKA